jgi:hypothetical protein
MQKHTPASFQRQTRPLIATLLFLGLAFQGFAQDPDNTQYGIKAGINFAELIGEDAIPESDRKEGYSIGGYMNFKLSKSLKLQPEVIWSLQGEESKSNGRFKLSYINIPVMLKWVEGDFYSELGPQLGIITISSTESVPESLALDNFETFELAVNAGIGYEVFEDWTIGLRYSQAVTNLIEGLDIKGSVFYVGIAYRIF